MFFGGCVRSYRIEQSADLLIDVGDLAVEDRPAYFSRNEAGRSYGKCGSKTCTQRKPFSRLSVEPTQRAIDHVSRSALGEEHFGIV
jgi:hypothetical protein